MATDQATKARGKGNHRSGRVRGTPARRGTLAWRDDPLIRQRIELVEELSYQSRAVLLGAVNAWLEKRGEEPISESTLKLDLARARELAFERITKGTEARVVDLERIKEAAWRDLNRLPQGHAGRPALYQAIFRAVVAQAQLDGSWRASGAPTPTDAPAIAGVGPSPLELLEQGRITDEEYRIHLSVFHLSMGGLSSDIAGAGRRGDVIDGQARELPVAALPAPVRPASPGGGRPPVRVTADGDLEEEPEPDGPRIIEWRPDDSEAFP